MDYQDVSKEITEKIEKIKSHHTPEDAARIEKAFRYAAEAHGEQRRKSGEPYIVHPAETAVLLDDMGLDVDSIVAGLLHDCIEDTPATFQMIEREFGASVANLVEGVTKLGRIVYSSKEEEQMEDLRKMFVAMAKDIRVILIKLADRLHNARTFQYLSPQKQREKALETMEIYAPLAHRLGMQNVKWELEDLSLKYLDPVGYAEITSYLDERRVAFSNFLETVKKTIVQRMEQSSITCRIKSRLKHVYSLYRRTFLFPRFMIFAPYVSSSKISPTVIMYWESSTTFTVRFLGVLKTISARPSLTDTSRFTPLSSGGKASPSRFRSAPRTWIKAQNTALPPIGNTKTA